MPCTHPLLCKFVSASQEELLELNLGCKQMFVTLRMPVSCLRQSERVYCHYGPNDSIRQKGIPYDLAIFLFGKKPMKKVGSRGGQMGEGEIKLSIFNSLGSIPDKIN